ncbi:MAG: serine/threonine protein kinase, partial [Myxococcota bacterium]
MQRNPDAPRPAELKRLGRYRIVRPLSKGGMALVYEARRESLAGVSPRVAIKLILPEHKGSETFRLLFINEAKLGARMEHQNLVQIQDFSCEDDTYFLVMEYVEGITLRRVISLCQRHDIPIPMRFIAEVGRQACDGLHYAHTAGDEEGQALGLVHRDVKPSNLMLNPHGVVKVLDFGISKGRLLEEREGSVKGTWGYMAPEQAAGRSVEPTADVFGLAVVLYELAARRPMFKDKNKDEIKRLLRDDHAARMATTLDRSYGPLMSVLVRALQRSPEARFSSAESFGRSLSRLLPDPITARDEVVRFYRIIDALGAGRVSEAKEELTGSLVLGPPESPPNSSGWKGLLLPALAGAGVVVIGAATLVGLGVAAVSVLDARSRVEDADAAPGLAEVVGVPVPSQIVDPPIELEAVELEPVVVPVVREVAQPVQPVEPAVADVHPPPPEPVEEPPGPAASMPSVVDP